MANKSEPTHTPSIVDSYKQEEDQHVDPDAAWRGDVDENMGGSHNEMVDQGAHSGIGIKEDG
jgi:hypothetical protein